MFRKLFRFMFRHFVIWVVIPFILIVFFIRIFQPEMYLMQIISQELYDQSGIVLKYETVKFQFPGSLNLKQVTLGQTTTQPLKLPDQSVTENIWFTGESFTFRIAFLPLLQRKAAIRFHGNAYGGGFEGLLETLIQTTPAPFLITVSWNDLDMELVSKDYSDLQLDSGLVSGHLNLTADMSRRFGYNGRISLTFEDTRFRTPDFFSGDFDLPEFDTATADIELKYSEIILEDIRLFSPDTIVRVMGKIYQQLPIDDSLMDIQVRLHFISSEQPFDEDMYIPFNIKGTFADPLVYFLGRAL